MSSSTPSAGYLAILREPRVRTVFASAVLGRLAYPFVSLPLLFSIQESADSYAAAGIATGLYGATAAFLAPMRSRLIDTHGPRRVLPALASAFALILLALAAATSHGSGAGVCAVLAGLAGVFAPPLGPVMRVTWSTLVPTKTALKKALSLDAVVEELLYLAGPAISGVLLLVTTPSMLLVVPAVLVVIGTVLMVVAPETSAKYEDFRYVTLRPRGSGPLATRAFVALLLPVLAAGLIVGTVYVAIPAAVGGADSGDIVGVLLAAFACGSALGGLGYGSKPVHVSPRIQLLGLSTLLSVGAVAMALVASSVGLGVILAMTGLFLSPTMIVAYVAASSVENGGRTTEAITWVNTSHNVGAAAGTFMAGFVIDAMDASAALVIAGAAGIGLIVLSATTGTMHGS